MLADNVDSFLKRARGLATGTDDVVKEAAAPPVVSESLIDDIDEALTGTSQSPRVSLEKVAFAQLLLAGDVLAKKGT